MIDGEYTLDEMTENNIGQSLFFKQVVQRKHLLPLNRIPSSRQENKKQNGNKKSLVTKNGYQRFLLKKCMTNSTLLSSGQGLRNAFIFIGSRRKFACCPSVKSCSGNLHHFTRLIYRISVLFMTFFDSIVQVGVSYLR